MRDIDSSKVWNMALAETDYSAFLDKVEDYFGEECDIFLLAECTELFKTAHMSIKDLIRYAGMTQKEFATHYCIPLRTIESWCADKRKCADYLRLLLYNDIRKTRQDMYWQIISRAVKELDYNDNQIGLLWDIESADWHFNLRLQDWLNADPLDFANDLWGIVNNITREDFPVINFNGFIPKFAGAV